MSRNGRVYVSERLRVFDIKEKSYWVHMQRPKRINIYNSRNSKTHGKLLGEAISGSNPLHFRSSDKIVFNHPIDIQSGEYGTFLVVKYIKWLRLLKDSYLGWLLKLHVNSKILERSSFQETIKLNKCQYCAKKVARALVPNNNHWLL